MSTTTLKLEGFNPPLHREFQGQGVFAGQQGEGTSPKIQFNVNTPATPGTGVLYVSNGNLPKNDAICKIKVPPGLRVRGGKFTADWVDVFTDNQPTHRNDEILEQISHEIQYTTDEIVFKISVNNRNLSGTINAKLTVTYEIAT